VEGGGVVVSFLFVKIPTNVRNQYIYVKNCLIKKYSNFKKPAVPIANRLVVQVLNQERSTLKIPSPQLYLQNPQGLLCLQNFGV
jgi:hypothetical protein